MQHLLQGGPPSAAGPPLLERLPLFPQLLRQWQQRLPVKGRDLRQQGASLPHHHSPDPPQHQSQQGQRRHRHQHGTGPVPPAQPPAQPGRGRVQRRRHYGAQHQRQKTGQRVPQPQVAQPQHHAPKGHSLQKRPFSRRHTAPPYRSCSLWYSVPAARAG